MTTVPATPYVCWPLAEYTTDESTLALYQMLPEFMRRVDSDGGYQLLRWLDCLVRQWGTVDALYDRFAYPYTNTATSDLVDPYTSDDAWLEWLGQLVNISSATTPGVSTTSSWDNILSTVDGSDGSSPDGIATWTEWTFGGRTWQDIQDLNIGARSTLYSVRDAINRRRNLATSYTTARSGYGYYDGSAASIATKIRGVLGGRGYVWVGNLAGLKLIGPVHPTKVTLAGSTSEYFVTGLTAVSATPRTITLAMDRTVTSTSSNASMTYGDTISVSQTTTALVVTVGGTTYTGVLPNGSRASVDITITINGTSVTVLATHTPNGGGPSTVINNVNHTITGFTQPTGSLLLTFGNGLSGDVYSATFDTSVCDITDFAVTNQFFNTGSALSSDAEVFLNNGGETMTFAYGSTPYSATASSAPEWTRIHVVTRSSERPSDAIIRNAAETSRPAGFTLSLHNATEGP